MAIYLCVDELLKERGMSVSKLALEVGITRANVSNIKTGNVKALRFSTLDKLCEVLNCEPGDIIKYQPPCCGESVLAAAENGKAMREAEEADGAGAASEPRAKKRPIVGIVPALLPDEASFQVRQNYCDAIIAAGGTPLILPLTLDMSVYEELFPSIDGFLLTGGTDIDPHRYGEEGTSDKLGEFTPSREEVECLILSYAYQFDVPVLGICRGMQMINVFFGGTLYLDLADQFCPKENCPLGGIAHWQKEDYSKPTHFVDIVRASKLADILQTDQVATNSMHHQGVRKLGPLLDAAAYGPDGLIEAIEVRDRSFIIGVQWHPEFFAGEKHMGCIFTSLIQEAKRCSRRARTAVANSCVFSCRTKPCLRSFDLPKELHFSRETG